VDRRELFRLLRKFIPAKGSVLTESS
jgi:hypothetical protein